MNISSLPRFQVLVVTLSFIIYLNGCDTALNKQVKEGIIEYDITYPTLDPNSLMAIGLPSKAIYKFKDAKSVTSFSSMMGVIQFNLIACDDTKKVKESLKLFDKKYVSEMNLSDLTKESAKAVKSIQLIDAETKEIAGYKCKKAKVILANDTVVDVYYTTHIGTENANWYNPYKEIKGMLMEFQTEQNGIVTHFIAKSISKVTINSSEFEVPADYKKITQQELNKIFEDLNPLK